MDSKIIHGRLGKMPIYGTVTNINSADVSQIIGATTGLVQTLGRVALVGGLTAIGVSSIFLSLMLRSMIPAPLPTIPMGCTPNYIKTRNRNFWGILLDDELEFESDGQNLKVPFDFVSKVDSSLYWSGKRSPMCVELVDGSRFTSVRLLAPTEFKLATLAGLQSLSFLPIEQLGGSVYYNSVSFQTPTIKQVVDLRNGLQRALDQNSAKITEIIGPDVLKNFFNVSSI